MPLGRRTSTICGVLAASVALSSCGGSSTVSASTYVKSICQAVGPFENDVKTRSSALNLTAVKSPTQGKQALQGFLTAVASSTEQTVSKLKSAGAPDVNNGKKISDGIVNAFSQLHGALGQASSSAGTLPTSNPTAFRSAASTLGTNVQQSMTNIGSSLSGLKSPALESAAKREPTCQHLSSSGG